ncbi:MAG: hypothetical protein HY825_16255 [Acidobacteria bacterium]|nr:hypothetical protein [Acidobacteriota bacterium]
MADVLRRRHVVGNAPLAAAVAALAVAACARGTPGRDAQPPSSVSVAPDAGLPAPSVSPADAAPPRPAPPRPLWLLVGPEMLTDALAPLVHRRSAEGFEVLVSSEAPGAAVKGAPRPPAYILLAGDDAGAAERGGWLVPSPRRELYRWQDDQAELFAADALLGDLDGDLLPDIPVGRLPVRTAGEAAAAAAKIASWEDRPPSVADLRLVAWGGSPDYGPGLDHVVAKVALGLVGTETPRWAALWLMLADRAHPLSGDPARQPETFARALGAGGFATLMIGHSWTDAFFALELGQSEIWFDTDDVRWHLSDGPAGPPAFLITCLAGDFTAPEGSLAEALLAAPAGPVAVVAATTTSHPLTNYYSALALVHALAVPHGRLGELWLAAQRASLELHSALVEWQLADVEGSLEPELDLAKLRRDQLLMYGILGDPATRMRLPGPLDARVEPIDGGWRWRATRPPGAVWLEVGFRVAEPVASVEALPKPEGPEAAARALDKAERMLGFTPVASLDGDAPWEGVFERPGDLRLVAETPAGLQVVVLRLE